MGVEVLVYIYLAVCLAMILFNIGTVIFAGQREKINKKRSDKYRDLIQKEAEKIRCGESLNPAHISFLKRKLRHQEQLLVFTQVMIHQYEKTPAELRVYLDYFFNVLDSLVPYYERPNDPIRYAFFLYSLKEFEKMDEVTPPKVADTLLRALHVPNTYCRENALQAIYSTGRTDLVIQALMTLDTEHIAHNKKLLCDGLLTFQGNKSELMNRLWDSFELFEPTMQAVILDYIRFCSPSHRDQILAILTDEKRSPELRFSCIRYFGKYPDQDAYPVVLGMANDLNNRRWEYPAIACTALASYPGEETVETLKRALYSDNWYIRYNAAESLTRLGMGYIDLIEIIDGNDRYAREIVQFQLDMQYNQQKEAIAH